VASIAETLPQYLHAFSEARSGQPRFSGIKRVALPVQFNNLMKVAFDVSYVTHLPESEATTASVEIA
jgi:hypothetical protein